MSFADPQSVTISGTAISLPRTSFGSNGGSFTSNDGLTRIDVSHQYGKTTSRLIKITQSKISADPYIPAQNRKLTASVSLVVRHPSEGFTVAELKAIMDGFAVYMAASTGAKETQLLGGEN